MSTKIFNGYRITGLASAADVFTFVTSLRAALEPVYRSAYATLAAKIALIAADRIDRGEPVRDDTLGLLTGLRHPLLYADMAINDAHTAIRRTGRRNVECDLQCDVALVPDQADPDVVYALLYTEREDYRQVFAALPGVQAWPYWNNSDRPDDLTDTEWDLRRQTWDRVLGDEAPARRGLCWSLLGDMHTLSAHDLIDEIAQVLPTLTRARALAIAERQLTDWTPEAGYDALISKVLSAVPAIVPTLRVWTVAELRDLPDTITA